MILLFGCKLGVITRRVQDGGHVETRHFGTGHCGAKLRLLSDINYLSLFCCLPDICLNLNLSFYQNFNDDVIMTSLTFQV